MNGMEPQFRSKNIEVVPYTPQTAKKIRNKTTVWLRRDPAKPRMFFCPNCQNPILKYHGGQVEMMMPGDADENENAERVLIFPIIIFCRSGACDMTYIFEGWAK